MCSLISLPAPPCPQEGIAAILTSSPTDVLSHIAIRARAQGVLLATCFDAEGGRALGCQLLLVCGRERLCCPGRAAGHLL